MPKWYHENAEGGTRNAEQGARGPCACSAFRVPTSAFGRSRPYRTNTLPDPLFPSLDAVTSANPAPTARTSTVWPNAPSIRATEETLTVHDTARPARMFPLARRRAAKKLALAPASTVWTEGVTYTFATGPLGRQAGLCAVLAASASAVAACAAVRTPFMRCLRECGQTGYPGLLVSRHISRRPLHRHSRSDLPFTLRIPHSTFRIAMTVQAIAWSPSGAVRIVDQRALPEAKIERDLESGEAVADAIRTLQLRGAPLIGIAAAMGLVAGMRELRAAPRDRFLARLDELARLLGATRPTAVNLRWALDRMARVAAETPDSWGGSGVWERLQAEATAIWEEDRAMCRRIGEAGLPLIPDGAKVLTHCNAGALATGGIGTALAPLYLAHEAGRRLHVFVDETRPVLQGARLTAWELSHAGIPCTLIADAAAGSLMRQAKVDLVIVGADRIAANGDFANKIGTYPLAVLALHHGVPFYCAAPSSTIDAALGNGDGIPIEQRSPDEVKP